MQSEAKVHATAACELLTRCSCRCSTDVGARSAPQEMIALLDRIVRCAMRPGPLTCRQTCHCLSMPMIQTCATSKTIAPNHSMYSIGSTLCESPSTPDHAALWWGCGPCMRRTAAGCTEGRCSWDGCMAAIIDCETGCRTARNTGFFASKHVLAGLLRDHPDTSSHMTTQVSELHDTSLAEAMRNRLVFVRPKAVQP